MSASVHWPDWAARIEQLNRELESSLSEGDWGRVGPIQSEKDKAMQALEGCLPDQVQSGTPEHRMLARLASQEEALNGLLTRAKDALGEDLRRTGAVSNLSKRFRASYGAKDPANPHWEHFS
jgi:hypothetical protein